MKPHIPPERSHGTRRECFDYSETHLSANRSGKTAPKLVCLPKSPGTGPHHPTRRVLALGNRHREQPAPARTTAIKRGRPHQTRPLSAPQWENPTARLFIVFPGDALQDRRGVTPQWPRTTQLRLAEAPLGRGPFSREAGLAPFRPPGPCALRAMPTGVTGHRTIPVGTIPRSHAFT